jgi:DNA-binding MarR family transcriptional regulator
MNNTAKTLSKEEQIVEALLRASRTMLHSFDHALAEVGLSGPKVYALKHLVEAPHPLGITQLAIRIHSGKSNATQLVDRLEAEGLVQRVPHPKDRRSLIIEVTDEGLRRFRVANGIRQDTAQQIFSSLNESEQQQLHELLHRFVEERQS